MGYVDSSNLYAAFGVDPVNGRDPLGLYDPAGFGHDIHRGAEWLKNLVNSGASSPRSGIGVVDAGNDLVNSTMAAQVNTVIDLGAGFIGGFFTIGEGTGNAIINYDEAHPYVSSAKVVGHATWDLANVALYATGSLA